MTVQAKRIILDDNPLFQRVLPVVLDIFCRGVQAAEGKRLMLGALISILASPMGWVVIISKKLIHIAILLVSWWFLGNFITELKSLDYVLLALGLVAIFYKDIHNELLELFLYGLVLTTGGAFLRWVCAGYLYGIAFRQKLLMTKPMETLIGTMVNAIPIRYRDRYDDIMHLYLDSNKPGNEDKLDRILEEYSPEAK